MCSHHRLYTEITLTVDNQPVDLTDPIELTQTSFKFGWSGEKSLLTRGYYGNEVLELAKNKYLFYDLIVENWEVTGKIENPQKQEMASPIRVPMFDMNEFPFVIVKC